MAINISIILPAYNSSKFIEKTLLTILSQTIGNYEIIVIDDGSDDDSYNIVAEIFSKIERKDIQTKLIKQEHAGVSVARNNGLNNAHGDYVLFFDSDDLMAPDCIRRVTDAIINFKCDNIIFGVDFLYLYEHKSINKPYTSGYEYFSSLLSGLDVMELYINENIFICVDNIVHRRGLLIEYNIHFPDGAKRGEDIVFNMKALYHSKSVYCFPASLATYVWRKGSVTSSRTITYKSDLFGYIASLLSISKYLEEKQAPTALRTKIDTIIVPKGYRTVIVALIYANYKYSEISSIIRNREIRLSLLKYKSDSHKEKIDNYMLTHLPTFYFIVTRLYVRTLRIGKWFITKIKRN